MTFVRPLPWENKTKTHCYNGHPLSGDNLRINTRGRRICIICNRANRKEWRQRNRELIRADARRRARMGLLRHGYTKAMIQKIDRDLLRHALETIKETGRSADGAQIVGKWRFKALLYFEPKIRRHVNGIVVTRTAEIKAQIIKPAKPALICVVNTDFVGRISAAVSRGLSRDHRDDVISDMVEAFLKGSLKYEDIDRRAGEFVTARFRSDHNGYGDLSLDVPVRVDGSATLLDRLSTEVGTGYWDVNMMASTGRRK